MRFAIAAIEGLSSFFAFLGGLVLLAIAGVTVTSVLGRWIAGSPITGDFEIVEVGCAVAIALFLPYCQLRRGNVIVDFFTLRMGARGKQALDALGCLLLTGVAMLLTWRLGAGGASLFRNNDQTMVLQLNTWWPFLVLVPCMALLTLVGLLTAWRAWRGDWTGDALTTEERH